MVSMASPATAFVFFGGLGLRLISRKGGLGLSLVFVLEGLIAKLPIGVLLIFFGRQTMTFRVLGVDFPNIEG